MPITSKELSQRLKDRLPLIKQLRKASIELNKIGIQIRKERLIKKR